MKKSMSNKTRICTENTRIVSCGETTPASDGSTKATNEVSLDGELAYPGEPGSPCTAVGSKGLVIADGPIIVSPNCVYTAPHFGMTSTNSANNALPECHALKKDVLSELVGSGGGMDDCLGESQTKRKPKAILCRHPLIPNP